MEDVNMNRRKMLSLTALWLLSAVPSLALAQGRERDERREREEREERERERHRREEMERREEEERRHRR